MIIKELTVPNFRPDIIGAFKELSNLGSGKEAWTSTEKFNVSTILDYSIFSTLYEDLDLDLTAYEKINNVLYDEEEAENIQSYCKFLFELLNVSIGGDQPDFAYIDHPDWPKVVEGAKKIYNLMKSNDEKYGFYESLDKVNGPVVE